MALDIDVKSMYIDELTEWVKKQGEPQFRAKQLYEWMHKKYAGSTDDMTNIPKKLREKIDNDGFVSIVEETRQTSKSDGTIKFLFR